MSKMASVDEAELVKRSKQLQERLGASPRVYIERFQNWGRNQKALVLSVKPKSLSDIQVSEKLFAYNSRLHHWLKINNNKMSRLLHHWFHIDFLAC